MTIYFPPIVIVPPAQPSAEIRYLRRQTRGFILADMRLVSFWFAEFSPNGAGGFLPSNVVGVYEQEMRLIPFSSTGVTRERVEGDVVAPTWILMGEYNALMEPGYLFFMPDGQIAEVLSVEEKRMYQTKGEVILRGRSS